MPGFLHDYVGKVTTCGRNARKDLEIADSENSNKNKPPGSLSLNRCCGSFAVIYRESPDRLNYISAADRHRLNSTSLPQRDVLFYSFHKEMSQSTPLYDSAACMPIFTAIRFLHIAAIYRPIAPCNCDSTSSAPIRLPSVPTVSAYSSS